MPPLGWYVRRAAAMSWGERLHRAHHVLRKRRWRRWAREGHVPDFECRPPENPAPWPVSSGGADIRALVEEANSYLRHEWTFFGLNGVHEDPIDWHADPASGIVAPRRFAFDIDHRDRSRLGDIKNTWEKSRHHHLTVLALASRLTGEARYGAETATQLTSWVEQNPFLVGVNWSHPLEHGIRLIAWVWCERLLRGSEYHAGLFGAKGTLWPAVHQHQWFIARTYARGSSANNHLIGEMAGLFVAATAWPYFPHSAGWQKMARRILEREIRLQTFSDGLNREMAFAYHLFTAEFLLLSLYESLRIGESMSNAYVERLRCMIEAVPALTDAGGNLPRYGDEDDGMALRIDPRTDRRDAWILEAGRAYAGARLAGPPPETMTGRVLGAGLSPPVPAPSLAERFPIAFPDAGIYVLATGRQTPREVFVLADAGPHGFLSIAAHAHADALSFTLSAGGLPMLVDPGTYTYYSDPAWRTYFRSTRAHNTMEIDGRDQSTMAGTFLWTRQARTWVTQWASGKEETRLTARHDGYGRMGVHHQRMWILREQNVHIEDHLTGTGTWPVALYFHVAPECSVSREVDGRVQIRRGRVIVYLSLPEKFDIELIRGGEDTGWVSPGFGVRTEACTVAARAMYELPARVKTWIHIHHGH